MEARIQTGALHAVGCADLFAYYFSGGLLSFAGSLAFAGSLSLAGSFSLAGSCSFGGEPSLFEAALHLLHLFPKGSPWLQVLFSGDRRLKNWSKLSERI
jgi:hypothetical protein